MVLDHVAVAARSIEEALQFWRGLGLKVSSTEEVPAQGVRVAFLELEGGGHLEILEPLGPASPIQGFLDKRGPGLHHLAFRTVRLEEGMGALRSRGAVLLNDLPRPGARGTRVCFVHPRSAGGVLVELVEPPPEVLDPRD